MDEIYDSYVTRADSSDPNKSTRTREQAIFALLQFAPFNQCDGLWLRNIAKGGPIDDIHSLLFTIWMDEQGDGNPNQNHANLYTRLLESVDISLPRIDSSEYAFNESFLESAFQAPLFELVISQFSEEYFPEILGMTLNLEWEVLQLKPTIPVYRKLDIDPHFYVMHVGIDNAVNGHGAKAKQAVVQYLDEIKNKEGEEAMQEAWKRIWKGYITFATYGTLGTDIAFVWRNELTIINRVYDMIARKAKYGMKNHGKRTLVSDKSKTSYFINDLFDHPDTFLEQLVEHGYIVPGDPDRQPAFQNDEL